MRCAVDLGGGAVGPERGGCVACEGRGGRAGGAAAEPVAGEGAGAGVHPAARVSGRSGGVGGFFGGRDHLPEPERLPRGHPAVSIAAVHPKSTTTIFSPTYSVFAPPALS